MQLYMQSGSLSEADVPGASFNGRGPEVLKVPELKLWLACRRAPKKGNKADLVKNTILLHNGCREEHYTCPQLPVLSSSATTVVYTMCILV